MRLVNKSRLLWRGTHEKKKSPRNIEGNLRACAVVDAREGRSLVEKIRKVGKRNPNGGGRGGKRVGPE